MSFTEEELDAQFKAQAALASQQEKDRKEKKNKPKSEPKSSPFQEIKWTGLEKGVTKIVRCLGEKPHFGLDNTKPGNQFDARVTNICVIVNDKNKWERLVLPLKRDNPEYFLWRIIDRMKEVEWVDNPEKPGRKKTIDKNESLFPTLYNRVNFNGLDDSDTNRKFNLVGKGWIGQEFLLINVIDRSLDSWHKENNHSALLSKQVNVALDKSGKEKTYVIEGVPANGFSSLLLSITGTYYYWGKYDIGIERTGQKVSPYKIFNASRTPEQATEHYRSLIVEGPMTEAEKAYARYDLDKLFKISSYSKIHKALGSSIAEIDMAFHTHFLEELESLVKQEAEEKETIPVEEENSEKSALEEQADQQQEDLTNPVAEVRSTVIEISPENMPGYSKLKSEEKALIKMVSQGKDLQYPDQWIVSYEGITDLSKIPDCEKCHTRSPNSFSSCPGCGAIFK